MQDSEKRIKVLIIDDSTVTRYLLTEILGQTGDMEVVAAVQDPMVAMSKILSLGPDVIVLDIMTSKMHGLAFLERLMEVYPLPVIMLSALSKPDSATLIRALEIGAVDYIQKESSRTWGGILSMSEEIIYKIRTASTARVRPTAGQDMLADFLETVKEEAYNSDKVIAIGASAGGTLAIRKILSSLPASVPGIVIAQHMAPNIAPAFAERLNQSSRLSVRQAGAGDILLPGSALLAPGNRQMTIWKNGQHYYTRLDDNHLADYARPSVDTLFSAVAQQVGSRAIGILLSGTCNDGAKGLLEMKEAGALTITQDENSSLIYGMCRQALDLGAAEMVAPLNEIPQLIIKNL